MTTSGKSVLIAGGTGMLGAQIGHSILDEGGSVRLLLAKPGLRTPRKPTQLQR
jgi:nucleoside-diphosphate-sugar epimerase